MCLGGASWRACLPAPGRQPGTVGELGEPPEDTPLHESRRGLRPGSAQESSPSFSVKQRVHQEALDTHARGLSGVWWISAGASERSLVAPGAGGSGEGRAGSGLAGFYFRLTKMVRNSVEGLVPGPCGFSVSAHAMNGAQHHGSVTVKWFILRYVNVTSI